MINQDLDIDLTFCDLNNDHVDQTDDSLSIDASFRSIEVEMNERFAGSVMLEYSDQTS